MGQLDGNHHQPQTNDEILERSKANDETGNNCNSSCLKSSGIVRILTVIVDERACFTIRILS